MCPVSGHFLCSVTVQKNLQRFAEGFFKCGAKIKDYFAAAYLLLTSSQFTTFQKALI